MDPIGFGLENFNAIGEWRAKDGESPVDASGKLTTGESFNGAKELVAILTDKKHGNFIHNISEKMLTYALGRGIERYDRPAVDKIVKDVDAGGDHFSSLILAIVRSVPFDEQRVDTPVVASVQ